MSVRQRMQRRFAARPRPAHADCPRCKREVDVDHPSSVWQTAKWIWLVVAAFIALIAPVVAADAFFLTPLVLAFLAGGGALMERAEEPSRCRRCAYPFTFEADSALESSA